MARRRRRAIGRGLLAAQEAIAPFLAAFTQRKLFEQQTQDTAKRQAQIDLQDRVAKGEISPDQAASMFKARTGQDINFEDIAPSMESRLSAISREIAGSGNLGKLPTEQRIRRRMGELRVPTEAPILQEQTGIGGFPLVSGVEESEQFKDIMSELGATREQLQAQIPPTAVEDIGPSGVARRRFVPRGELGALGELQTERTAEQETARQIAAEEGLRGPKQETFRQMTPLEAARSGAAGFAGRAGQIRAESTPEALAALERRTAIEREGKPPAQGEARAFDFAKRAASSHETMLRLEPAIAKRGIVLNTAMLNVPNAIKDPVSRQYAQAMRELINANLRRESGAAISSAEFTTAREQYGFTPGDDPGTLALKRGARRRSIQGMITESGPRLGESFVTIDELKALGGNLNDQLKRAAQEGLIVIR